ncbi:MAG: hypothetical protein HY361_00230 [Candidatus Aenigmarchaeota archaeon]|nr:hypothetical protein [Candidatus Aenigmarchaeota archaeon]
MKGIIFTTDALLATLAFFIILTASFYIKSQTQADNFGNLHLSKAVNDILTVLNKNRTLETVDKTVISDILIQVLPPSMNASLRVQYFKCSNQQCDSFSLDKEFLINNCIGKSFEPSLAKTSFLTFESNRVSYFGLAELGVCLL